MVGGLLRQLILAARQLVTQSSDVFLLANLERANRSYMLLFSLSHFEKHCLNSLRQSITLVIAMIQGIDCLKQFLLFTLQIARQVCDL